MEKEKKTQDLNSEGEDLEDTFEIAGIKIENEMDENLKKAIAKYNLVHEKIVSDINAK